MENNQPEDENSEDLTGFLSAIKHARCESTLAVWYFDHCGYTSPPPLEVRKVYTKALMKGYVVVAFGESPLGTGRPRSMNAVAGVDISGWETGKGKG